MKQEHEKFWEGERDRKAKKLEMTREEVVTLASIVDEETLFDDENSRVAGLYLNRLEQGIPLQADPTLKFALGDFSRQRILNEDKEIDSPYNTYKFKGLPRDPSPFPRFRPSMGSLSMKSTDICICAPKLTSVATMHLHGTYSQHLKNARAYQRELNKRRIYK